MKFMGTITNWPKFSGIILESVKELEFMGEVYKDEKDIKKYARESFLASEPIRFKF